ncbi:cation transporter, partial [Acinetobacter baumannii]
NGVILIGLSVWIVDEAITRLAYNEDAHVIDGHMLDVAIVGLLANATAMWLLSAAQRHSLNVRGAYIEVMGDLLGSAS